MAQIFRPGWEIVEAECRRIVDNARPYVTAGVIRDIHGVPRGGCVPAAIVATLLELPLVEQPNGFTLVVDDLVDSGATARRVASWCAFDALFRKPWSPVTLAPDAPTVDAWIELPWELAEAPASDAVLRLLQIGGLDTTLPAVHDIAAHLVEELASVAVSAAARRLEPPGP